MVPLFLPPLQDTMATERSHAGSDGQQRLRGRGHTTCTGSPPRSVARSPGDADAYVVEGEVPMPGGVIRLHRDAVDTGVRIAMRNSPPQRVRPVTEIPAHGVA